jgi:hypothetical protein
VGLSVHVKCGCGVISLNFLKNTFPWLITRKFFLFLQSRFLP